MAFRRRNLGFSNIIIVRNFKNSEIGYNNLFFGLHKTEPINLSNKMQPFDGKVKLTLANNANPTILSLNNLFNFLIIIKILNYSLEMIEKNYLSRIPSIFIFIFRNDFSILKLKIFSPNTKRWKTLFSD